MKPIKFQKSWLPYIVATLGIIFSFSAWYLFRENFGSYFAFYTTLAIYHPWLDLLSAIGISILIGIIIGFIELTIHRSEMLRIANENLLKQIAERKLAEETRQHLEAALLQGQKLQAIGTLAGGIAHDFNNILYAIIGYIELAQEDVAKGSLVHKNLGKVLEGAHRGQELVSRILAFSRRQHHEFEPLDLNHTIESALSLLRPTIPASVIIQFEPTIETSILGNQTQIHQVLINLINNAVDAMDGEGMITISTTRVTASDPYLKQFPEIREQNYSKIEISDTGYGMDQGTMNRIFEPFFTTKEVGKGTGLGLSIVHSIIKESEGVITVNSKLGLGSTFTILLPERLSQ